MEYLPCRLVDTFRSEHASLRQYTRYASDCWDSEARLDYIFASPRLVSHFPLLDVSVLTDYTISDHHPVVAVFQCPSPILLSQPPLPPCIFRKLSSDEKQQFSNSVLLIPDWCRDLQDAPARAPLEESIAATDSLLMRVGSAYHKITRLKPQRKDQEGYGKLRKLLFSPPPPSSPAFPEHIAEVQSVPNTLRSSDETKAKRKLHSSLVRGVQMKSTVARSCIYKLLATFARKHLRAQAFAHDIPSEIQHGGLPGHKCADHLYHLKALYAKSKKSYSLFIDFNKASNSVPHGTLRTVLERANFSTSTIFLIKQLYSFPQDSPVINGPTPHAYLQTRCLRQGCPLSPLLFILYLNSLFNHFFATVPPPRANARTSHHAYIHDILIRSEDVIYIQNSLNYLDGPARDWGLDMNVSKTEVHANGTAPQKELLTPRRSGLLTYNKKTGRPHTCNKYLGVYLFTCHQAKGLFHMLKAEIQFFFAGLSPLPLTLSEKVRLTNSQLVPALAYRLITHSPSPNQLEKLQSLIWAGVASRSITRLVFSKDRFAARPKGGLGMKFLPHSVHIATVNYGLRALCGLAPKSVGPLYVQSLLSSNQRASDPVQNSFIDSIHARGISFHSIGPWRPTGIRDLTPGTQLTVRFTSGQAT